MGRQIVKVAPDVDAYLEWSSIVDAPVWAGTRDELLEYLVGEHEHRGAVDLRDVEAVRERIARADETGSSGHAPFGYGWTTEEMLVMEGGGPGMLPRARLGEAYALLRAEMEDGPVTDLAPLLTELEDE